MTGMGRIWWCCVARNKSLAIQIIKNEDSTPQGPQIAQIFTDYLDREWTPMNANEYERRGTARRAKGLSTKRHEDKKLLEPRMDTDARRAA
jgi:hypothetical protein